MAANLAKMLDPDETDSDFASGAHFDPTRVWRYALWRNWDWQGHANRVMFIGMNPSKANEVRGDNTVTRCINFAKQWGFSGMFMLNLYGLISTDPMGLVKVPDPNGPGNDEAFGYYRSKVGMVVAAWGSPSKLLRDTLRWDDRVQLVLESIGRPAVCLGKTVDGSPRHPSRLGYSTQREFFWDPAI